MRVFAIEGSRRRQGNTQSLLEMVLQAAADAVVAHLWALRELASCRQCQTCQEAPAAPGCVISDDLKVVIDQMLGADLVVLATPVLCRSVSWHLQAAIERFYCLYNFGGDEQEGADPVAETFRRLAQFSRTRWLGALLASNLSDPDCLRADTRLARRARRFGRGLLP